MANIKINGKTYSNVGGVKFPLADNTGFATFVENEGGEDSPALYPLPYINYQGAAIQKLQTNGNHLELSTTNNGVVVINLVEGIDSITKRSFAAAYNRFPLIPANTEVTFAIENVENNGANFAVGMTIPNASTSINNMPLGQDGGSIGGTSNRKSYTFTTSEETQISSFYCSLDTTLGKSISFDLSLTVGGVRWI
jgi:hypothetical protein